MWATLPPTAPQYLLTVPVALFHAPPSIPHPPHSPLHSTGTRRAAWAEPLDSFVQREYEILKCKSQCRVYEYE